MSVYVFNSKPFFDRAIEAAGTSVASDPGDEDCTMLVFPVWGELDPLMLVLLGWELHRQSGSNTQFVLVGHNWPISVTSMLEDLYPGEVVQFGEREDFAKWLTAARPAPNL